jgi:hypothetical protein
MAAAVINIALRRELALCCATSIDEFVCSNRHRQHLPAQLIHGKQAQVMAEATTLLERVESLIQRLETIAQGALEDRAWSSAAAAMREIRGCFTFLGQLTGELPVRACPCQSGIVTRRI